MPVAFDAVCFVLFVKQEFCIIVPVAFDFVSAVVSAEEKEFFIIVHVVFEDSSFCCIPLKSVDTYVHIYISLCVYLCTHTNTFCFKAGS